MCKAELIAAVVEQCPKDIESKAQINRIVDAVFDTIADAVVSGDKVTITGFGTFELAERKARTVRAFGKDVEVPAKTVPKFTAGKAFKSAANQ